MPRLEKKNDPGREATLAIRMASNVKCILPLVAGLHDSAKTRGFFSSEFVKSSHFDEKFIPMRYYISAPVSQT